MGKIVGIDFGTTNSLAAYMFDGVPRTIKSDAIEHILPSVICKYDGKLYIGKDAKENIAAFDAGTGIIEIKKQIGAKDKNGKKLKILFDGKQMEVAEISAIILKKIKRNLELYFGEVVDEAVITVPEQFSDEQRNEIIHAGQLAGFKVKKIINEPTAALLAYANVNKIQDEIIICYDFGGGTFDVSIARIKGNGYYDKDVSVIGVGGDRTLGGSNIDHAIKVALCEDVYRVKGKRPDSYGTRQILLAVEKMKIELSQKQETAISIPDLRLENGTITGYFKKISRTSMETIMKPYIQKTIDIVKQTMDENDLSYQEISTVLLVGGSSRIPMVQRMLEEELHLSSTFGNLNPDECVALGASIEAANISGDEQNRTRVNIKRDVCPFTLGLKYEENGEKDLFDPLITKNFPYGEEYSEEYVTVIDRQKSMKLEIYQGESDKASENEKVCTFEKLYIIMIMYN